MFRSNPQEFEEKVQALKEQKRSDKLPLHPTDESSKQLSPPKVIIFTYNMIIIMPYINFLAIFTL